MAGIPFSISSAVPCLSFWASLASRFLYASHVLVYMEGLSSLDPIPLVRLLLGFGFPIFLLDCLTCLNGPPLLHLPVVIMVLQISVRYNSKTVYSFCSVILTSSAIYSSPFYLCSTCELPLSEESIHLSAPVFCGRSVESINEACTGRINTSES